VTDPSHGQMETRERTLLRRWAVPVLLAGCWLGAVAVGLVALMDYDNSPGPPAEAPAIWPADSDIPRDPTGPTLVMLAHPRCDCTRASIGELAELMARAPQRPRAYVVFIKPGSAGPAWEHTSLWDEAARIPDVTVLRDDHGREAARFRTQTSGQTLLYGADGRLLFAGGTTGARGKAGNNAGRATLLAWLTGERPQATATPVFGCSLFGPADEVPEHDSAHHES